MLFLKKKGCFLDSFLSKGAFRGHFLNSSIPPEVSPQFYLGGKSGCKIVQNSCFGGVFPGKGKSWLGYVLILKTSGCTCV